MRCVFHQASVALEALRDGRQDVRKRVRLIIQGAEHQTSRHLGATDGFTIDTHSLSHKLRVLIEVIESEARVLNVVGVGSLLIVWIWIGTCALVD